MSPKDIVEVISLFFSGQTSPLIAWVVFLVFIFTAAVYTYKFYLKVCGTEVKFNSVDQHIKDMSKSVEIVNSNLTAHDGRLLKIETDFSQVSKRLPKVEETIEKIYSMLVFGANNSEAFRAQSPINLTKVGWDWLRESGLETYVNENYTELKKKMVSTNETNPYKIQEECFEMFDFVVVFDTNTEEKVNSFAFRKGTQIPILRRCGGIYFRNLIFKDFGIPIENVDRDKMSTVL
jgi:tetrahydromethanopterin S-methyltransferase subunit G